jgi:transforming growth factor-beta-induced protein
MAASIINLMISPCIASYLREAAPVARELRAHSLPTIDTIILNDPNLTTLAVAFESAGLVGRLCTTCNFTVFAPVNEAFAAVDQNFLKMLLTPSWVLHLQNLLAFHVTLPTDDGLRLLSVDYIDGQVFEMLNSEFVTASDLKSGITLTSPLTVGSKIVEADILASNGALQKVDTVLSPAFFGVDVFALGDSYVEFTILQELMDLIGLAGTEGEFTVLAPINEAFLALGNETLAALKEDKKALGQILANHVIVGVYPSTFLENGLVLESLGGLNITITASEGIARQAATVIQFNDATAILADILARNGIVHAIDTVILDQDSMSRVPTAITSSMPSEAPSSVPSDVPSSLTSDVPSSLPSDVPSDSPSDAPSDSPSAAPSSAR